MAVRIEASRLVQLLGFSAPDAVSMELTEEGVRVAGARRDRVVPFEDVVNIVVRGRFFWRQVELNGLEGCTVLRGVSWRSARRFCRTALALVVAAHQKKMRERIQDLAPGQRYIRWSDVQDLLEARLRLASLLRSPLGGDDSVGGTERHEWRTVYEFLENPESARKRWNEQFISTEREKWKGFFDTFEPDPVTDRPRPLTDEQRRAVITDEDNTLVVAAAGSGKTSLVTAKVAYLLKADLARPDEVLALCFTKDAADELRKRVLKHVGASVHVTNFHKLGYEVIGNVDNGKPPVAEIATDEAKMMKWLNKVIENESQDRAFAMELTRWASYLSRSPSLLDFANEREYEEYIRNVEPRSLKGDLVKSCEECEIANFLYLNGIAYEYEALHPTAQTLPDRKRYQPDFFLKEYNIYIEHFAIDELGKPPAFMDQVKYTKEMDWKRGQYDGEKLKLVETYSYERRNGTLLRNLEAKLMEHGVTFQPMVSEDPLQRLRELGQTNRFSKLLYTLLRHVKSNQHSMEWLRQQADVSPDAERARSFLFLFERVYARYIHYLKDREEIDFYDMVNRATEYVWAGKFRSPYRFIVVDEFQDISVSLARLVLALLNQNRPDARLFCVGDDWQAIYRFAGADLSVMQSMEEHFGHTKRLFLTKTFRFNSSIARVSSSFILKNKAQIEKQVVPTSAVNEPCIFVIPASSPSSRPLQTAFRIIAREVRGNKCEVLLLSRYSQPKAVAAAGYLKGELTWLKKQGKSLYPNVVVCCDTRENHRGDAVRTVHSVKGLEADFVIVVGLCRGLYGFPCEIMDDPIIDMVLAKSDPFPHAEERRLFYVALTRAKKAVFLVTDSKDPSAFIAELELEDHLVRRIDEKPCPKCGNGVLVLRDGRYGEFLSCSNYPTCRHTEPS